MGLKNQGTKKKSFFRMVVLEGIMFTGIIIGYQNATILQASVQQKFFKD